MVLRLPLERIVVTILVSESTADFNTLFPGTAVEVYEWVESKLLPSEWDALVGTEAGTAQGISGTSKYGDSAYSVRRRYSEASQTFTNYYYYCFQLDLCSLYHILVAVWIFYEILYLLFLLIHHEVHNNKHCSYYYLL